MFFSSKEAEVSRKQPIRLNSVTRPGIVARGEASGAISALASKENRRPRHSRFILQVYSMGKSGSRRLKDRGCETNSTVLSDGWRGKEDGAALTHGVSGPILRAETERWKIG